MAKSFEDWIPTNPTANPFREGSPLCQERAEAIADATQIGRLYVAWLEQQLRETRAELVKANATIDQMRATIDQMRSDEGWRQTAERAERLGINM